MTDGELVRRALLGDRAAGEQLVRRWSAAVLALCHARVGNRHAAEDLAQESLLRGLRGLASLETPDKFGAWLRGIATRVCLDWHKAQSSAQIPFTTLAAQSSPEDLLADNSAAARRNAQQQQARAEQLEDLLGAVEALPEKQREVVLLYYYQDVTYHDLAEMLGVSSATINARLTQARTMLRERLLSSHR